MSQLKNHAVTITVTRKTEKGSETLAVINKETLGDHTGLELEKVITKKEEDTNNVK